MNDSSLVESMMDDIWWFMNGLDSDSSLVFDSDGLDFDIYAVCSMNGSAELMVWVCTHFLVILA